MSDKRFHSKNNKWSAQSWVLIHIGFYQRRWVTNITCVRLTLDDYPFCWEPVIWQTPVSRPQEAATPSANHLHAFQQLHLCQERKTGVIWASVFISIVWGFFIHINIVHLKQCFSFSTTMSGVWGQSCTNGLTAGEILTTTQRIVPYYVYFHM